MALVSSYSLVNNKADIKCGSVIQDGTNSRGTDQIGPDRLFLVSAQFLSLNSKYSESLFLVRNMD